MWNFVSAVKDYRFLKNNHYSEKSTLALVGDRYQLTKIQRNCLLRGVVEQKKIKERSKKMVAFKRIKNNVLAIDWYNVLITVEAYLKGAVLFLSDDGVLRDAAAVHGSYRKSAVTEKAIQAVIGTVIQAVPERVEIVLDEPVSFSGRMIQELAGIFRKMETGIPVDLTTAKSADFELKKNDGIVASSDSAIIDAVDNFADLPRMVLHREFSYCPPTLEKLVFHK